MCDVQLTRPASPDNPWRLGGEKGCSRSEPHSNRKNWEWDNWFPKKFTVIERTKDMRHYSVCLRLDTTFSRIPSLWGTSLELTRRGIWGRFERWELSRSHCSQKVVMARYRHGWAQRRLACSLSVQLLFFTVGPADDSSPGHHQALRCEATAVVSIVLSSGFPWWSHFCCHACLFSQILLQALTCLPSDSSASSDSDRLLSDQFFNPPAPSSNPQLLLFLRKV